MDKLSTFHEGSRPKNALQCTRGLAARNIVHVGARYASRRHVGLFRGTAHRGNLKFPRTGYPVPCTGDPEKSDRCPRRNSRHARFCPLSCPVSKKSSSRLTEVRAPGSNSGEPAQLLFEPGRAWTVTVHDVPTRKSDVAPTWLLRGAKVRVETVHMGNGCYRNCASVGAGVSGKGLFQAWGKHPTDSSSSTRYRHPRTKMCPRFFCADTVASQCIGYSLALVWCRCAYIES